MGFASQDNLATLGKSATMCKYKIRSGRGVVAWW